MVYKVLQHNILMTRPGTRGQTPSLFDKCTRFFYVRYTMHRTNSTPIWIKIGSDFFLFFSIQLDNKGRNFLHIAIQKSDIESVLFLISVHANVNSSVQDSSKHTPLHLAVQASSEIIVRNLVRNNGCFRLASLGRPRSSVVRSNNFNGGHRSSPDSAPITCGAGHLGLLKVHSVTTRNFLNGHHFVWNSAGHFKEFDWHFHP